MSGLQERTKMTEYRARKGFRINNEQAQRFGNFLDENFSSGGITPEAVVEKAKEVTCVIHDMFEWDDRVAAHEHRLQQARSYIRSIVVYTEEHEEIRAFHHVTVNTENEYVPLDRALEAPELWQQILNKALEEARQWSERYSQYKQLSAIHNAIRRTYSNLKQEQQPNA